MSRRLVFVYNVDASPLALLKDLHAGITTGTTDCHLCDLTFGRLLKDRGWNAFVKGLPVDVDFQLRSTFRKANPSLAEASFPAAYLDEGGSLRQVIGADEMNAVGDLDELRALVQRTVDAL